ncbi:hypothetical protein MKW98_023622 [Papaver atlanticum]|uniref:Uncharacterized protein n=1 Tax=Papaver atlanticum TaxID=357466 RepID=A0AAD4SZL4_9MAGN|nr:hypothetical protein MKW98_023622 [Papaver atlanticum]
MGTFSDASQPKICGLSSKVASGGFFRYVKECCKMTLFVHVLNGFFRNGIGLLNLGSSRMKLVYFLCREVLTIQELLNGRKATKKFNSGNLLGSGGFGPIYKDGSLYIDIF